MLETYKALVEMSPEVFITGKMVETFTQVMLFINFLGLSLDDIAGTRDNVPIMVDDNPQS